LIAAGLCLLLAAGCATTARDRARTAELAENFDEAVVEYTRALQDRPDDRTLRRDLERARLRAALYHQAEGLRLTGLGNYEDALVEYQIAAELNPTGRDIQDALRETGERVRTREAARRAGQTEIEALIERTRFLPPEGLELPDDFLPDSLVFRDASTRDVFTALGLFSDVNVVFDPAFVDQRLSVDLRDARLTDAFTSVARSTQNFYRVTAPRTITVIPDTPAKRTEYEDEIVQTFYLSNADMDETIALLRLVLDLRRLSPVTATRSISIRDTPERVAAAARLIATIDKAPPEVVIDVELLEVDRQRLRAYGLQFASADDAVGLDGALTVDTGRGLSIDDLGSLTAADIFVSNIPGLFYRLLKRDQHTHTLANPHLRTSAGQTAQAQFGDEVPVPVTEFTPFAAGGLQQQPVTSFNYRDVGVNIEITPHIHHNDEVSLELLIEVISVSGVGYGDIPTFGERSIATTIRLRNGETNILAGMIRDDEREVLEGIPGLSDLPIIGRLFARNRLETQETDIIVTLTPRIVRGLDLEETDLRAFRVEDDIGGLDVILRGQDAREPVPVPGALRPPGRLSPAPFPEPGQVLPILPPPLDPPR
jgi:general secretion pathway protein D